MGAPGPVDQPLHAAPDGSGAGLCLRLAGLPADPQAMNLGLYTRVVDGQQLFEHTGGLPWSGLAVGYHWVVRDNLELATQLSTDLRTGASSSQLGRTGS